MFGLPLGLVLGFLLGLRADSAAAVPRTVIDLPYQCTIVASTRQYPSGVQASAALGAPDLNAWGQIAFMTPSTLPGGHLLQELRVGTGEVEQDVIQSNVVATAGTQPGAHFFTSIESATIDDQARVTFLSTETDGPSSGQGIHRAYANNPAGYKPPRRYATTGLEPSSPHAAFSTTILDENASGSFLFESDALYRSGSEVARRNDPPLQTYDEPVLHRFQPWTAFIGSLDSPPFERGIWVNGGLRLTVPGEASIDGLSIAGGVAPVVTYVRTGLPGIDSWELAITSPVATSVWVDADEDPFGPFDPPLQTALSPYREVAFVASPTTGGKRIYVADGGQQIRRVVCQNQLVDFGGPFADIVISPKAFNADGQIAFRGRAGPDVFLVRADPLPGQSALPTDCTVVLEGRACDDGDPITLAYCQAGTCTNDPIEGPPQSCVGQPDETLCSDGDPDTISMCTAGSCVGTPLPAPEPVAFAPALPFLGWLARRRRRTRQT